MMRYSINSTFLVTALCSVLLSGCFSLFPDTGHPAKLYVLTPKSTFPESLTAVDWQLGIETPYATAALDTARVAVLKDGLVLDYFSDVNWESRAPQMVQNLLIESFDNTGVIVGVGRTSTGLRPDFILKSDLREFQANYFKDTETPKVRVHLGVKVIKMPERKIVAAHHFDVWKDCESTKFVDIVRAFDSALGKVQKDIVIWTLTNPHIHKCAPKKNNATGLTIE